CLQLTLLDPPSSTPIAATMLCQDEGTDSLASGALPVVDTVTGKSEILLFGSAPGTAETVTLTAPAGASEARTTERITGTPGRSWVMAVPSGRPAGSLHWKDAAGVRNSQ